MWALPPLALLHRSAARRAVQSPPAPGGHLFSFTFHHQGWLGCSGCGGFVCKKRSEEERGECAPAAVRQR